MFQNGHLAGNYLKKIMILVAPCEKVVASYNSWNLNT